MKECQQVKFLVLMPMEVQSENGLAFITVEMQSVHLNKSKFFKTFCRKVAVGLRSVS